MSPEVVGLLGIFLLVVLIFLNVHVGLVLGFVGFLGFWLVSSNFEAALGLLWTTPYVSTASFALAVLPLFILMGVFTGYTGLAEDAYDTVYKWVGNLPGGLAITTIGANAIFGAASGSSAAACAVFSKFAFPEMKRHGYEPSFACATISAAGVLSMLIPPSVLMIVYGIITNSSIGEMFIAGIFPGLLVTLLYCLCVPLWLKLSPGLAARTLNTFSWKVKILSLRKIWGVAILVLIILGGIYGGVFTPTEAGAVGAFAAFVFALAMRKLNLRMLWATLKDAGQTTAIVFFVFIGAQIFAKFLAVSQLPMHLVSLIQTIGMPPWLVLSIFLIFLLALGCILDSISMMLITLPVMFPVSQAMGWDPIWFGIVSIVAIEVGLLTPPLGINVFVVKAAVGPEVELMQIFKRVVPYFITLTLALIILALFPAISIWLPNLLL